MIQVLLLLFSLHGAWAQGHGVGNGGDGFEIAGQVYMRDLLEAGLETTALAPADADSDFVKRMRLVPIWRPFASQKLAGVLERLERVSPGAGRYLLYAIRMHTWTFVNVPLRRISDNCDILSVPNGSFVQIANRLDGTIRINEEAWSKMSDENQIALIVHEAIYSLIHPSNTAPGKCLRASVKTREIVSLLLSRDFELRGPQLYRNLIEPEVDWPAGPLWDLREDADSWTLWVRPNGLADETRLSNWDLDKRKRFSTMVNSTDLFCQLISISSFDPQTMIHSRLSLLPFMGEFVRYDAEFGEQFHLKISRREGSLYLDQDLPLVQDRAGCVRLLQPILIRAMNEF